MRLQAALSLIFLAGCSGTAAYTESDHDRTVSADLGTTFTLSLPDIADPIFSAGVLEYRGMSRDAAAGLRTYTFFARSLGETMIRIQDFSMRVRVVSASGENPVHTHNR